MRRVGCAFALGIAAALLPVTPALAQAPAVAVDEMVYAVFPITVEQARELSTLLRSPGTVAVDLADATEAVLDVAPALPAAVLHDVLTAPVRDWHLLRGVATDTVEFATRPPGASQGVFQHTLRALNRSKTFTAVAGVVRRVTQPTNRTARLAIVLVARGYGIPVRDEHLDMLDQAIRRDDPDLGPAPRGAVETLVRIYGRHAVRLILGQPMNGTGRRTCRRQVTVHPPRKDSSVPKAGVCFSFCSRFDLSAVPGDPARLLGPGEGRPELLLARFHRDASVAKDGFPVGHGDRRSRAAGLLRSPWAGSRA